MKRTVTVPLLLMILALSSPAPASAIDSFFDIFTEVSVAGPPYPTEPLITIIGENVVGSFQPQQHCQDEIAAVRLNGLPPGTPVIASLHGGGAGGLPPSIDSFFDVFFDIDFTVPTSGQLKIVRFVAVPSTPTGTYLQLLPINPLAPPGTPASFFDIFVDDSFFDVFVDFEIGPGPCHPFRCSEPDDLCMVTTGTRVPNPVSVQPATWTTVKSLLD